MVADKFGRQQPIAGTVFGRSRLASADELSERIKSVVDSLTASIEHNRRLAVDQAAKYITPKYVEYCDKIKKELESDLNEKLEQLNAVLKNIKAAARTFYNRYE